MSKALDELAATVASPEKKTKVLMSTEDKWKALKSVEKALNAQFGTTTSIVRLGSKVGTPMPSLSTGLYTVDYEVIGTGGIPKGRIIEFFGPESGGKTTTALQCVAAEQARGGICAFIDAEHALDPTYAAKLGVNVDDLVVAQPDSGEQALETLEALVESQAISLAVVDSVAALVPQAELDGEMGDSHMGLQARLMSQAMRKLRGKCAMYGIPVIFINQIREKLGVMFGNPETTTGGRALKFYSSVRIDIRRVGQDGKIMSGGVEIGTKTKLRAVKNKVGPPFRSTIVDLIYGEGIDTTADMIEYGINIGAVTQSGAWFEFGGQKFQGRPAVKVALAADPTALAQLREEITKAQKAQKEADAA